MVCQVCTVCGATRVAHVHRCVSCASCAPLPLPVYGRNREPNERRPTWPVDADRALLACIHVCKIIWQLVEEMVDADRALLAAPGESQMRRGSN
jgi:hypothetical protein